MEQAIPYFSNCRLGYGVDVTKFPLQTGRRLVPEDVEVALGKPNFITSSFSFVESMRDVCDILGIPPEYALKVRATIATNPIVSMCLKDLRKSNIVTVVFRVTYLQQKRFLTYGLKGSGDTDSGAEGQGDTEAQREEGADTSHTHMVNAVEIGNEMVVILKISSPVAENFTKFSENLRVTLRQSRGTLDNETFAKLETFATSTDKKLKKSHYKDVNCSIHYGCYNDKEVYQSSIAGMVSALRGFTDKVAGWAHLYKSHDGDYAIPEEGHMTLKEGVEPEKKGILSTLSDFMSNKNKDSSEAAPKSPVGFLPQMETDVDGRDHDSFVVLASESDRMYYMRVTLQSEQSEESDIESFTSFSFSQYREGTQGLYEKLFIILNQVEKAISNLQALFSSRHFLCDNRVVEGNQILRSIQNVHLEVHEAIKKMDMITMPSEDFVANICSANPLQTANDYIKNVMSKLPPGCDLDLLIIGKTGHGKSSTGNTILGQQKFVSSASGESVTRTSSVGWSNVDGRIIKVVDTPGVCDTAEELDSIDQAIRAISEAISQCPGGFHALLLVIRFGQRMTMEERKAIGMLKCILGENVIKMHCICVVTYGDNFDSDMEGRKTFKEWCSEASGYLKDLFEECEYRCVLFNNKSKDPKVIKGQLIKLIGLVDSLKSSGTRYTNSLFEFALQQREQITSQEECPPVTQDMMRDIELVLDHLKRVASNTQQREKYAEELENLKRMVENLSNRANEVKGDQVKLLVETVFSLAEVIHGEIDKIADSPDNSGGNSFLSEGDDASGGDSRTTVSPEDINPQLEAQTKNLQKFRDQQAEDQANNIDQKVADEVAKKIVSESNCFPADSTVMMKDGLVTKLEDLQVGDEILARNENGEMFFDTVYVFGHRDPDIVISYIVLQVDGHSVFVSDNHLVFCVRNSNEMCLSAKDVCVGDELLIRDNTGSDIPKRMAVLGKSEQRKRGAFAPFTKAGTVVVDGAVMSCYVDVLPHHKSHALLFPVRQLYRLSPSLLAFVSGGPSNTGIPPWAKLALKWVR